MNDQDIQNIPESYFAIDEATKVLGFTMPSDMLTCSLLRTLAASKPSGRFLELGTGTGLSTSWILNGMDKSSTLISIDNDKSVLNIAKTHLGKDSRLSLVLSDGEDWILKNINKRFDYIFADTWHGKYLLLEEVLDMLNPGGLYIVDDMLPQSNWPEGHAEKAIEFVKKLDQRTDLKLTKLDWATGIIIGVKIK
ncbi:O-methyltransferase [Aquiflexum gelatinilyticum]|uniref:Class I SAM-dependent methyltransferase n=1 Tax=Aquiflexum gelatinilyticum TaxID=2961943 RepID=A0A9X2P4K9_9BACT|nr:class I SAM-dependent methyltransferase [Aquiflexum gelatinilyticum]MCR9016224.1 class I SAM-dependent methyltransferase [Aquiflexum gelatinilyticum]